MAASDLWLYRADTDLLRPVRVHCPDGRYPAHDADGKIVYENTHFDSERDAWECLFRNAQAGVSLAGGRVKEARQRVLEANQYAADMAVEFETVRDGCRDFARAQESMDIPTEELCDE
jgi:hypothetical protein